jgi:Ni/Fe-hydrogenase subunit HybB-like protein
MFAPLMEAVRSDIDRQVGWARGEVQRQTRHTALIGAIAAVATVAVLGAIIVGLIALYFWLSIELDPFAALGIIGGGLLALALILIAFVLMQRRPRLASRPQLLLAQPTALIGTFTRGVEGRQIASQEDTLRLVADTVRQSPPAALLGVLLVAAIVGVVTGRRFKS